MTAKLIAIPFAVALFVCELPAQSALSTQGFGYPAGGLSVRALSVGGGSGEIDPLSTLNPAALSNWGAAGLEAQFAPERRSLRGPDGTASTTTVRFPLFAAGMSLAANWKLGISSSTMLDRSWSTRFESSQVVGGQQVASSTLWSSRGAINDVRFAVAYRINPRLSAGAALHVLAGSNIVTAVTDYTGSDFLDLSISTTHGYAGRALSAGLVWSPLNVLTLGVSARSGSTLTIRRDKQDVGSASVPDRMGASLMYSGISGSILSVRYDKVAYSQMNGLGSSETNARDTQDIGVGVEFSGPRVAGAPSFLRIGVRDRGLPFDAGGTKVTERTYAAGFGVSATRTGRDGAMFDFGVLRLTRDNNSSYRESAWIFAAGILVRP